MSQLGVLCVHGIWDSGRIFDPLRRDLLAKGWSHVEAMDLVPSNGSDGLKPLAMQVQEAAQALCGATGRDQVDVVGFSMGALVARYWIQAMGGHRRTRRFVSLCGPHRGSWWAHFSSNQGGVDMRPNSPLLRELAEGEWGATELHAVWTPLDLMVVPATSGRLVGAHETLIPVLLHGWVPYDRRVRRHILETLAK